MPETATLQWQSGEAQLSFKGSEVTLIPPADICEISVVVNAHREGLIAASTLRSVERAAVHAQRAGIRVELIIVLDRGDKLTQLVCREWCSKGASRILYDTQYGDLGLARNEGAIRAKGEWLAFVDADDLIGENWLTDAFRVAISDSRPVVWHPELNIAFGSESYVYVHVDMESPFFDVSAIAVTNLWTALTFSRRSMFLKIPYRATQLSKQIGFEDWGWAMETIEAGYIHKIVEGTVHAIRKKTVSLVQQTTAAQCLPTPSDLFIRTINGDVLGFQK